MWNLHQVLSMENLVCFLAAAEHLNFRKAAEQMAITPAAFGQRIKQLERQLGCVLFQRTSRSVRLSLEGTRLLPKAKSAYREMMACKKALYPGEQMDIHLLLGTRFELGLSWVLPSLLTFQKEYPHFKLDFYFGSGPDILKQLKEQKVHGIITSAPQSSSTWSSAFLHEENYVFVGSKKLLKKEPFRNPCDAIRHTLLDIDATLPLTRYMTSVMGNMEFGEIRLCGTGAAVEYMVQEGLGVAVLPEYMLQKGTLHNIFPKQKLLTDSFRLLYKADSIFREPLQQIADYLKACPLQ